ncbi:MAG TPA: glycosyltransferase [Solirubrobacterales bacterium]|nr:glycosyltransferase [Solirubrobacterales bacterium]
MPSQPNQQGTPAAPSISVIVTAFTFDRIGSIEEIVDSMRQQTVAPAETLLVIDYAPELEEECRRRWPDIRVIPNTAERGSCGGRNTGVAASTGEIVAFLDDDAIPNHEWIERLGADFADQRVIGVAGGVNPRWLDERPSWFPPEFDWVVGCMHSGMPKQREPVRNAIAANMAIRREEMLAVGGLRKEFSRIEKNAAGGEETDLCIRLTERWQERMILFDPVPAVEHCVPPERGELRYFITRCFAEGRSKAALARLVGSQSGLSSERSYVRRTLPLGVLRNLGGVLRGEFAGIGRAAMIVAGLGTTVAGYATASHPDDEQGKAEAGEPRPLRVLTVTPLSPLVQGGVERHVSEVTRRLAAAGAEVEVLCTEPGGAKLHEEERDGVRIRVMRSWPANRDWCFAPRLWGEIRRAKPDVIHVQSYHTAVAPLAMLRAIVLRVPFVVTFHGGGHSSGLRNRLRRLQRLLMRPLLRRAARLIAVARFEIDEYSRELRLPAEKFALIPNGTELAFSDAGPPQRNGRPTFATVGRLERYKGHHRVLAALPEVLALEPKARLLIVGSGPYEAALREQAEQLDLGDAVEFTSIPAERPEAMAELLRGVSLVVLLSEFETHPLVALEAAAAGCRLLVADTGGLSELARDGFARAVPLEESPQQVGAAVVEELSLPPQDKRPPLSTWDECAAELLELYRSLV